MRAARRVGPWAVAFLAVTLGYVLGPARAGHGSTGPTPDTFPRSITLVHPVSFFDQRTFALALARAGSTPPAHTGRLRGILIPHHWFAADLIVQGLHRLQAGGGTTRVVLIGPNHIGTGGATFTTSRLSWKVPGGVMRPDLATIERMSATGLVRLLPSVMQNEHSVAGLIPAVAHFFPRATVVPVAVHARPTAAELGRMSVLLASLLSDPGTIVVSSVDFSHYRSAAEAERRNEESIDAISSFDLDRVLGFGNEHMDSPATIALLLRTMSLAGAGRFTLWTDTNSARLGGPSMAPNVTSYVTGGFA